MEALTCGCHCQIVFQSILEGKFSYEEWYLLCKTVLLHYVMQNFKRLLCTEIWCIQLLLQDSCEFVFRNSVYLELPITGMGVLWWKIMTWKIGTATFVFYFLSLGIFIINFNKRVRSVRCCHQVVMNILYLEIFRFLPSFFLGWSTMHSEWSMSFSGHTD